MSSDNEPESDSPKSEEPRDADVESLEAEPDVLELGDAELELQMVRAERDEYLDALRRLQADFENYRKRVQREQSQSVGRATEALIEHLLPVLDGFDLALGHARATGESPELTTAFSQIGALLASTLEREGLERIDESGETFDPTVHDAVAHEPDEDGGRSGAVVTEVLRAGYRLKGRVLRPAMVRVRG
jgi:molecular chaperone GrpE